MEDSESDFIDRVKVTGRLLVPEWRNWLCPTGRLFLNTTETPVSLEKTSRPISHERTGCEPRGTSKACIPGSPLD